MLGRLHMTLDECEAAYLKLSERIFNPRRRPANMLGRANDLLQAAGRFDTDTLREAIQQIIRDADCPEDALLKNLDSACKV
jgi:hypothetical protein